MANFRYQARDAEGRFVEGTWESGDARLAREELQQRGLSLLNLQEEAAPATPLAEPTGWDLGVSRKELARFTRQLSTLLRAGMSLMKSLESVSRRSSGPSLRRAVIQVARQINEGTRLSQALATQPEVFDDLYIAMIKVGEVSGELSEATDRLATLLERDVAAERRVGMALTYPLIVLGVAGLLTWGIATFMMPIFEPMFKDAGLNLARDYRMTWFLLQLGHLGGSPVVLGGVVLGAGVAFLLARSMGSRPAGRLLLDTVKLNIPVMGSLIKMLLTARMARALSAMTRGGIPLVQALNQAGEATGNRATAAAVAEMARGVQEGRRLSQLLAEQKTFDAVLTDMVEVGEQSGMLPEMLDRAADYFDDEADGLRDRLTTAMEPFMMLLVGTIVSVFVVALMVPLMSLSGR